MNLVCVMLLKWSILDLDLYVFKIFLVYFVCVLIHYLFK